MPRERTDRGVALIMVISVIGVLALMIAAFAATTRIERAATSNYVDAERAKLLAWSGVERAKFELRRAASTPSFPLPWMTYTVPPAAAGAPLPPIEFATAPSFRLRLDPLPAAHDPAEGEPSRPLPPFPSGVLGASYYVDKTNGGFGGDYYVLKVEDCNGKLYLNDQNPHLPTMLDTLGQVLVTGANLGSRIVAGRPAGGYRNTEELRHIVGEADFALVAPFVTCHGFVDRRVIEMGLQPEGPTVRRPARLALQPRAPINVNTAPLPVLVAVLNGIGYGNGAGETVTYAQATTLAQALIGAREAAITTGLGLRHWNEMYRFLLGTTVGASPLLTPKLAAAVMANCNPNSDLNKFVPDLSIHRAVDKSDLRTATTELTFAPGGVFDIESLGVVLAPDDEAGAVARIVAQSKVRSTVRIFERYVDTTQDDFETDRVDPASSDATFTNLRDMTTLPEYRNLSASGTDLLAASWDGQVTFNVIARQEVSSDGGYAGFIEGTLDGKSMRTSGTIPDLGTAREDAPAPMTPGTPRAPRSVVAGNEEEPGDFAGGSDLHPFGARLNGQRYLAYAQEEVVSLGVPERVVPPSEIILTDGHGAQIEVLAEIPGWRYQAVDAQGFEVWFKPDFPRDGIDEIGQKQVLLDWVSGIKRPPNAGEPLIPNGAADLSTFVSDVHEENFAHYMAAVALGGPGPGTYPVIHGGDGAFSVAPPPISYFFPPLPNDAGAAYRTNLHDGIAHPASNSATADAETYARMADSYFASQFAAIAAGLFGSFDQSAATDNITWGSQARMQVWIQRVADGPLAEDGAITPRFGVFAKFEIEHKGEEFNSTSHLYSRTWNGPTVAAGTWHHALFSFYAIEPSADLRSVRTERKVPNHHTNFYVDGQEQPATGADDWPTEIHAQARIAKRILEALAMSGVEILFNVETYRVPVQIPRGTIPVRLGMAQDGTSPFRGLVDNVVFQGNWPRWFDTKPGDPAPGRFDHWRPTLGGPSAGAADNHLRLTKRTKALEWDTPIRIVSYAWTSWKHNDTLGGALGLGLI